MHMDTDFSPTNLKVRVFTLPVSEKMKAEQRMILNRKKTKTAKLSAAEKAIVKPWIRENVELEYHLNGDEVYAFPTTMEEELLIIQSGLYIKKAGVPVGKLVRNELLPAHELALSRLVNEKLFTISLKKDEALQYLRKEEVTINADRKGWALVQYEGHHLGWIKMLGNRINNYYPKEWRILKSGNV